MKVSFVISSVGRKDDLQACLSSIERAHEYSKGKIGVEIICVIESANNIQLHLKFPDKSKFYYFNKINLSAARNYGIGQSSGEYLVFIDDDASIKEDFLDILQISLAKDNANAFCGRILCPNDNLPFSGCYKNDRAKILNWYDFNYFKGSDMVIKKDLINKLGGFDELFGSGARYYGAEDSDLFFKLMKSHVEIFYLPGLVIYHPVSLTVPAARIFNYSYAVGAMLMKQMTSDWKRSVVYASLAVLILSKSLFRAAQNTIFPKMLRKKNAQFRYAQVFKGTSSGIINFIKNEKLYKMHNEI